MKRTIFLANRAPLSRLSLMVSSIAVAFVAFLGFAPAAQATEGEFEFTFGAGCNAETGVLDYWVTDIANNTPEATEFLITMNGETVESQLLNPGDTMPDVVRPFPLLGLVELFVVDPTGVEAPSQLRTAYYSVFHSCVDPVVTFEEHGGDEVTDPQCVDGEQFEIPAAPIRSYIYSFTGWNSAADGTGTAYEVGSMHDCLGLITIHATWAELTVGLVDPVTQVSVDLDTECSAVEDGSATWTVSQFTNNLDVEARFEILVDGSIVRAVALWNGGILPDFTGDLASDETIEVRVILDGNTATLASATNSCRVNDLIDPVDPVDPVGPAAEELSQVELPNTGTDQPKWPILLLIGVGSALMRISRRPKTSNV